LNIAGFLAIHKSVEVGVNAEFRLNLFDCSLSHKNCTFLVCFISKFLEKTLNVVYLRDLSQRLIALE
jgi:hypothetical protein